MASAQLKISRRLLPRNPTSPELQVPRRMLILLKRQVSSCRMWTQSGYTICKWRIQGTITRTEGNRCWWISKRTIMIMITLATSNSETRIALRKCLPLWRDKSRPTTNSKTTWRITVQWETPNRHRGAQLRLPRTSWKRTSSCLTTRISIIKKRRLSM